MYKKSVHRLGNFYAKKSIISALRCIFKGHNRQSCSSFPKKAEFFPISKKYLSVFIMWNKIIGGLNLDDLENNFWLMKFFFMVFYPRY